MIFDFTSEIKQLDGKIKWSVFYFPYSTQQYFGTKGNVPVIVTIDGHEFNHMLLPSKNGHYLVYNEFIKNAVGKIIGDSVHVTLQKDDKKRAVDIPEFIKNEFNNANVLEPFLEQPDYIKREQINYIQIAKKEETKINRLAKLVEKLK